MNNTLSTQNIDHVDIPHNEEKISHISTSIPKQPSLLSISIPNPPSSISISSSVSSLPSSGPYKDGYLNRRIDRFETWQRRFYILENYSLKYFSNVGNKTPKGVIHLQHCQVQRVEDSRYNREFVFEIINPYSSRVHILQADNHYELQDWLRALYEVWNHPLTQEMPECQLEESCTQFPHDYHISQMSQWRKNRSSPLSLSDFHFHHEVVCDDQIYLASNHQSSSLLAFYSANNSLSVYDNSNQSISWQTSLSSPPSNLSLHSDFCVTWNFPHLAFLSLSNEYPLSDSSLLKSYSSSPYSNLSISSTYGISSFASYLNLFDIPSTKWIDNQNLHSPITSCHCIDESQYIYTLGSEQYCLVGKDRRKNGVTYCFSPHHSSISSLAISPLYSHYIALGYDQGDINIYDLRYLSSPSIPLYSSSYHHHSINSLSFSNSHSEFLLSSSLDHNVVLSHLSLPSHSLYYTYSCPSFPLLAFWDCSQPLTFYYLEISGQLSIHEFTKPVVKKLIQHRLTPSLHPSAQNQMESNLLEFLYLRDLKPAYHILSELIDIYHENNELLNRVHHFLQIIHPRSSLFSNDLSFSHQMKDLSYTVPTASIHLSSPLLNDQMTISAYQLRYILQKLYEQKGSDQILSLSFDILNHLKYNPYTFSSLFLSNLVYLCLTDHYLSTLSLSFEMGQILLNHDCYHLFLNTSIHILYPTVYHSLSSTTSAYSLIPLERDLSQPSYVLGQISLIYKVYDLLSLHPNCYTSITNLIDDISKVLNQSIVLIYFNCLLHQHCYDKYIILLTNCIHQYAGHTLSIIFDFLDYEFSQTLQNLLDNTFNFFQKTINETLSSPAVNSMIGLVVSLVNINEHASFIPLPLAPSISSILNNSESPNDKDVVLSLLSQKLSQVHHHGHSQNEEVFRILSLCSLT